MIATGLGFSHLNEERRDIAEFDAATHFSSAPKSLIGASRRISAA